MSLVAVVGSGSTTTALGLAAAWRRDEPCMVVELDPAGGCLSAWLDVPRSPGLAELVAEPGPMSWPAIQAVLQASATGIDVVVAPTRAVEAAAAVHAAEPVVIPVLAAVDSPVVVVDAGRSTGTITMLLGGCAVAVVAHRQRAGSAAAAALGLERTAELVAALTARSIPNVVALLGERPYTAADVAEFVDADAVVAMADDPWAAAVLAGRSGSAARFRRSALMRSLSELASVVAVLLQRDPRPHLTQAPVLVDGRA